MSKKNNEFASNFALSLNIPPQKLFGWFRRPPLWAIGDWQLHHDNTPFMHHILCRVFWWNIKLPRWLNPSTAQIWHPATSGFSQNQNHLWKGKDFRPLMRFRKTWQGSMATGRTVWGPKVPTLNGLRCHCPLYNIPCIFFNKYLHFHITWLNKYLLDCPRVLFLSLFFLFNFLFF